jgi:hypothetical protein
MTFIVQECNQAERTENALSLKCTLMLQISNILIYLIALTLKKKTSKYTLFKAVKSERQFHIFRINGLLINIDRNIWFVILMKISVLFVQSVNRK